MKQIPLAISGEAARTFESFLAAANRPAVEHLLRLAGGSAPVYLWGPPGSGKTHLLSALAARFEQQGERVGWFDARSATPWQPDESWALIVFDACDAFDAGQQQAAFALFVESATRGVPIAAAGRVPPVDLPLREDLRTRLGWGHIFALKPLADAEARAALRREADSRGIFLSDDVMNYLLTRFDRDLGHLMAQVDRLDRFSMAAKRPITVPLLKRMLSEERPTSRGLCLFDLDDTLLPLDSDHAWGEFMIRIGWVDEAAFRRENNRFFEQYKAGALDVHAYVRFATGPLRERSPDDAERAHAQFMREVIGPNLLPQALDLVREHQQRGDLVALVTATNDFVTAPIARAFGIADLLAVRLERGAGGTITGAIAGMPSYREGKVMRVQEWLAGQGLDWRDFGRVTVYSDSVNDLPLLERASDPVATNPSPALASIATERGWRTLNLFP